MQQVSTSAVFLSVGAVLLVTGKLLNSLAGLLFVILPPKFLRRPMMVLGVCGGPPGSSSTGPECEARRALEEYSPSLTGPNVLSTVVPSTVLDRARSGVGVTSSAMARADGDWGIGERGKNMSCICRGIIGVSKGDERGGDAVGGKAGIIFAEETVLLGKTFLCFLDESGDDEAGL
jgi:hypothetical protein